MDDGGFARREARPWEFESIGDSPCERCLEAQCVCGDAAFESWLDRELTEQREMEAVMRGDL